MAMTDHIGGFNKMVPSEEEVALAIKRAQLGERAELSTGGPWRDYELKPARAILALFAPILAENARVQAALAAERERCAKIAERLSQAQAAGWRENPKLDGCGGSIAASNTGVFIAAAIRSQT